MLNFGTDGGMVFEPGFLKVNVGDTVNFKAIDLTHNTESVAGLIPDGATGWKGEINENVSVVIDKDSVPMISGAEIDYVEDLMKSGFTIHNPNAVSSCACGSSFQTSDGAGVARPCS